MSPVVLPPLSAAYCSLSLAPPPASMRSQPVGSVVLVVPELANVLKSCAYAEPKVVRLTVPAACAGSAAPTRYVNRRIKTASTRSQRQRAAEDWAGILFSLLVVLHKVVPLAALHKVMP